MKVATFIRPYEMKITEIAKPVIEEDTDAIIKVIRACVCGSDLWFFRGIEKRTSGAFCGHEAIGIVEEVGKKVTSVKVGDFVIAPFTHGCGTCSACKNGFDGSCVNLIWPKVGYQAEYLRFTMADFTLVKVPGKPSDYSDDILNSLLTLSDVMATGYHAAITAEVKKGDIVVVIGDGAVGLCGVISAKMLGASKIIIMSKYKDRQDLAIEFGATDIIEERGEEAVKRLMELTNGYGADAALECVGTEQALMTAIDVCRPGAIVGRVGVPQEQSIDVSKLFFKNVGLRGGVASVTTYDKQVLLEAVLKGEINPGKVFDKKFKLDDIQKAYEAMDKREAIKSLIII